MQHREHIPPQTLEAQLPNLQGARLHVILLQLIAGYSVVFTMKHLYVGEHTQAYLTAAALPSSLIGWWLNAKGRLLASKIWNVSFIMMLLFSIGLVVGNESLFFLFFFPTIIGALIQFQGKYQWIGWITGGIGFVLMLTLLLCDFRWAEGHVKSADTLLLERAMNLIASGLATALEVVFIMRMSADMEHRLVKQRNDLNDKNQILIANTYSRDRMSSVLSHDLRAPLAALEAGMNLLDLDTGISPKNKELIRNLSKRTRDTHELLNNLLLWSKQTTQISTPIIQPIALSALCHYVESFTLFIGGDKGVEFTFEMGCDPSHEVHADEAMLHTIFRNLISNALQHTESGGVITLACHPEGERTHFVVSDTGRGMNAQQLADIQAGILPQGASANHGLGLQLVREFLKNHGSELRIESSAGKGSRFMFSLS
ncbi:MAG: sensor histidine kinase [Flavobacteriales bacterium]